MYLEQSFTRHALNMFKRLQWVQGKWAFDHAYYTNQSDELARLNKRFAMNYLRQLRWRKPGVRLRPLPSKPPTANFSLRPK